MKINTSGLKGILADYRTYAEQKDRAYAKLQQQITEAKEVYNAETLNKFIAEKSDSHEKEFKGKFDELASNKTAA